LEHCKLEIDFHFPLQENLKNSGVFTQSDTFIPYSTWLRSGQAAGSAKQYSIIFFKRMFLVQVVVSKV